MGLECGFGYPGFSVGRVSDGACYPSSFCRGRCTREELGAELERGEDAFFFFSGSGFLIGWGESR